MKSFKLTPPEPTEAEIQNALIGRLHRRGWIVVRINGGGFYDSRNRFVRTYFIFGLNDKKGQPACSGFPDLLALRGDGQGGIEARLFEIKKQGGEVSEAQQRFIDFADQRDVPVEVIEGFAAMEKAVERMDELDNEVLDNE